MPRRSKRSSSSPPVPAPARRGFGLRALGAALAVASVSAAAAAGWGWYRYAVQPLAMAAPVVEVIVEHGTLPRSLAALLAAQGVEVPPWALRIAARLRGDARAIKAGSYELSAPLTLASLLDKLVRGDVNQRELRIVEGWSIRQLRAALDRHPDLRHETTGLGDAGLLAKLGAAEPHPEGLFAPDTYLFARGSRDVDVLRRAYRRQQRLLADAWARRDPRVPLASPAELLVLASIVEKETGREDDRPRVAAVFTNRLRAGMRLQSDPTTIYGLAERFDGDLRRSDLRADTPWNTYTREGLPPTPISMPGRASLEASIAPAPVRSLYFVARGDGSSEFNDDLDAHNRAVARWQRRRAAAVSQPAAPIAAPVNAPAPSP